MAYSQIGARKGKSVRNCLFVLNSILSDVLSSRRKELVDSNMKDFKHILNAKELPTVLKASYESGVKNYMLALVNEANKSVKFAVKTTNMMTETSSIHNKIMQGDVLSPLVSSNMDDVNITSLQSEQKTFICLKIRCPYHH